MNCCEVLVKGVSDYVDVVLCRFISVVSLLYLLNYKIVESVRTDSDLV